MTAWQQDGKIWDDAGDMGGDDQAGAAASVRFMHPDMPGVLYTVNAYPYIDSNAPGGADVSRIGMQVQTEYMICTDPSDPGSTEQWCDYLYELVHSAGTFPDIAAAEAAALEYVRAYRPDQIEWDGQQF